MWRMQTIRGPAAPLCWGPFGWPSDTIFNLISHYEAHMWRSGPSLALHGVEFLKQDRGASSKELLVGTAASRGIFAYSELPCSAKLDYTQTKLCLSLFRVPYIRTCYTQLHPYIFKSLRRPVACHCRSSAKVMTDKSTGGYMRKPAACISTYTRNPIEIEECRRHSDFEEPASFPADSPILLPHISDH
jgi:hypothetical protein